MGAAKARTPFCPAPYTRLWRIQPPTPRPGSIERSGCHEENKIKDAIRARLKTLALLKIKCITAFGCAAVGGLLAFFPWGDALVFFGYDLVVLFSPPPPAHNCIVVEMDEKSYQELKQEWGQKWDRLLHARLIDKLSRDQAKLTVLDVIFLTSSTDAADRELAKAIRMNGKVVLAASLESVNSQGVVGTEVRPPLPGLAANAAGWGLAEVERDVDQTVRRLFSGRENHASLAWAAASALGSPVTHHPELRLKPRWINYFGPPQTLASISYSAALAMPDGYFHDRIVFVGGRPKTRFVGDEVDEFATPFTRWNGIGSGGVELMATSTLNLVQGDWLRRLPLWLELIVVLTSGIALGFALCSVKPFRAFLIGTGIALAIFASAMAVLWLAHAWFAWAVVAFAQAPLALALSLAYRMSISRVQVQEPLDEVALAGSSEVRESEDRDYSPLKHIGSGSYGDVWLCKDRLNNDWAVKFVGRNRFDDLGPLRLEFQGLKNFATLRHPRLLGVYHVHIDEHQRSFYYVMELADDLYTERHINPEKYVPRTLATVLDAHGRLSVGETAALGASLGEGLAYMHSQDMIHRDIKPANIVYVHGMAKFADIGLVSDTKREAVLGLGTEGFKDPHCAGTDLGDIYSLAIVLFVAVSGLGPKQFPEFQARADANTEEPGRHRLNAIIKKACCRHKEDRYPSVVEMRKDLEELCTTLKDAGGFR